MTCAVFILGTSSRCHVAITQPSREIAALDIPDKASEMYFCDIPAEDAGKGNDLLHNETNVGKPIYIASDIISAHELRQRLLASGTLKSLNPLPVIRNQDGSLNEAFARHAVWLAKSNRAAWHVVGRNGEYLPVIAGRGIIVIDAAKNILMGAHDTMPRRLMPGPRITPPSDRRFKL